MLNDLPALRGAVAKEIYRATFQVLKIRRCRHHISLNGTNLLEGTVVNCGIDLHTAGIYHRYKQGVLGEFFLSKKNGHT